MDAPPKFKGTGSCRLEGTNFPGFGKMQFHLASAHSSKIQVTRRNQLIRRGSSKTMKNDTIFLNELVCQDARLASSSHPMTCFVLRHHIDGVSSPLTCASGIRVVHPWRVDQTQPNWGDSSQERTVLELKEEAERLGTEMNSGLTATGQQLSWRRQQMATAVRFWQRQLCRLGAGCRF